MAGGVDQVELVSLAIPRLMRQCGSLRFDRVIPRSRSRSMESSTCSSISPVGKASHSAE
jgi:hypothetical protein